MFWRFKLSFDEDILAFSSLANVLATFSKIWVNFFPNLLVTLLTDDKSFTASMQAVVTKAYLR